jgi:hypothetical protein
MEIRVSNKLLLEDIPSGLFGLYRGVSRPGKNERVLPRKAFFNGVLRPEI